jgi:hypothetical protein
MSNERICKMTHTNETKEILRLKMTGKKHSQETKDLLRDKMRVVFGNDEKKKELGEKIRQGMEKKALLKLKNDCEELMQPVVIVESDNARKNRLRREKRAAKNLQVI